jgi:SAM-dependent methyltransferase
LAKITGCQALGLDINTQGITVANEWAAAEGLAERVKFQVHDANLPLPFSANDFDVVISIDAIGHLQDRAATLAEWGRVLKPGGRLMFSHGMLVTGAISNLEIAATTPIGFELLVPPGLDERLLQAAGLRFLATHDSTDSVAAIAGNWLAARAKRESTLRQVEGDARYDGQTQILRMIMQIFHEHRLSRVAILAEKPT